MEFSETLYGPLAQDSILRSLMLTQLYDFLGFAVVKRLTRNETLIEAGDPDDSMMIVLSATLQVCVGYRHEGTAYDLTS
jgi:CRP-like cAMP-binding protein